MGAMRMSLPCSPNAFTPHLIGSVLQHPADVSARLGVVQAQDYAPPRSGRSVPAPHGTTTRPSNRFSTVGGSCATARLLPTWHFVSPA